MTILVVVVVQEGDPCFCAVEGWFGLVGLLPGNSKMWARIFDLEFVLGLQCVVEFW